MIQSNREDNPRFYCQSTKTWTKEGLEYYGELERTYTGHRLDRYLRGLWVAPEGARFGWLERGTHTFSMRERFPHGLPSNYKVVVGMDYGIRSPFAAVWCAISPEGDIYVFREAYEKGLDAFEQAQMVVDLTAQNERISAVLADSACWQEFSSKNLVGHSNISVADYYSRAFKACDRMGPLLKGWKGALSHSFATLDLLLTRGNGHRDLWIEDRCTNLWRELVELTWDPRSPDKEEVVGSDHAVDALRYAVHNTISPPEADKPPVTAQSIQEAWAKDRNERCDRYFRKALGEGRRIRI
jgi:phage terminase large subunit